MRLKSKDSTLLEEAYRRVLASWPAEPEVEPESEFITKHKRSIDERNQYAVFGVMDEGEHEGRMYVVVATDEKYDDGDRWWEETNYNVDIDGVGRVQLSEDAIKELERKAVQNHPELNDHLDSAIIDGIKRSGQ